MKTIKIQKLTETGFAKYGSFTDMLHPSGERMGAAPSEFYRDILQMRLLNTNSTSFSVNHVQKREMIIDTIEYHSCCSEGTLPLDGDIVVYVAPADEGAEVPSDKIESFLIPKGTLAVYNPGVWHYTSFPNGYDEVNTLIVLPERTYANDCKVFKLKEKMELAW